MTFSKSIFILASLAGALIFGSLSSCGVTTEADEEMEKASVSAEIDTVIVTLDPCIGCAQARSLAVESRQRAMAQAAAEAEARARAARDAQIARISACVSQRAKDLKVCGDAFERAKQGMAADDAACVQRATTGCSSGNTANQIATCVGNSKFVAEEHRRSCINAIPSTASDAARSQAAGRCFTNETLGVLDATRFCNGAQNFNGYGSPSAMCTAQGKKNCLANFYQSFSRQDEIRLTCISRGESQFLDCLLPGM